MTGVSFQVNTDGAVAKFKRMRLVLDPRTLLNGIGLSQLNWVNRNFRRQGSRIRRWAPLSPNTIASRRQGRGAGSTQPLRDTGRLAQSFVHEVVGNEVSVGTENKIAEFHHFGTSPYVIRPKRAKMLRFKTTAGTVFARSVNHPGLPARPLLPTKALAETLALKVIVGAIKAAASDGAA